MAEGMLRKTIYFDIVASSPSYTLSLSPNKMLFSGARRVTGSQPEKTSFLDSRYEETKYFNQSRTPILSFLLLTNLLAVQDSSIGDLVTHSLTE